MSARLLWIQRFEVMQQKMQKSSWWGSRYKKNYWYLLGWNTTLFGSWNSAILKERENICLGSWFKTLSAVFQMAQRFAALEAFPRDWRRRKQGSQRARYCNLFLVCHSSPLHRWNVSFTKANNKILGKDACAYVSMHVLIYLWIYLNTHTRNIFLQIFTHFNKWRYDAMISIHTVHHNWVIKYIVIFQVL